MFQVLLSVRYVKVRAARETTEKTSETTVEQNVSDPLDGELTGN